MQCPGVYWDKILNGVARSGSSRGTSQIRSVLSAAPETTTELSGWLTRLSTGPLCPASVRISLPVAASHNLIV